MKDSYLKEINKLVKTSHYNKNSFLFFQGDPGKSVYFLRKGKVKAIKSNPEGEEQILEILQPGDVFGEVVLFGIDYYPATAVAMQDVTVSILSRKKFKDYFYKNPDLGWGMMQEMARKLDRAQRKVENLGLRDTRGRVASMLIDLLNDFGDTGDKLILDINRQEMANFIGTTRETVSRTLSEFRKKHLIKIKGNRILIKDIEGLNKYI